MASTLQRTWNNLAPNSLSCLHPLLSLLALKFHSLSQGPCHPMATEDRSVPHPSPYAQSSSGWVFLENHFLFTLASNILHKAPEATRKLKEFPQEPPPTLCFKPNACLNFLDSSHCNYLKSQISSLLPQSLLLSFL